MSLLQLILRVTWHGFLQFADNTIYACGYNLRYMQLLGASVHNFFLFWAAITLVVALLVLSKMELLWLLDRSYLRWSCSSLNIEGL